MAAGAVRGVLVTELLAHYQALSAGAASSELPALTVQYADFAQWQRTWLQGEVLEKQLTYWKTVLSGSLPVLELPYDYPRLPVASMKGAVLNQQVPQELVTPLEAVGRKHNATLYMVLLAAFHVLLRKYSRAEDMVIGTPIANRNRKEIENLIGFFVNTLAVRMDSSGNPTFVELLGRVKERMLGAYEHQDLPFEKLVDEVHPVRDMSRAPLFQVMFVLQNAPLPKLSAAGLEVEEVEVERTTAQLDLTLSLRESSQRRMRSAISR